MKVPPGFNAANAVLLKPGAKSGFASVTVAEFEVVVAFPEYEGWRVFVDDGHEADESMISFDWSLW